MASVGAAIAAAAAAMAMAIKPAEPPLLLRGLQTQERVTTQCPAC